MFIGICRDWPVHSARVNGVSASYGHVLLRYDQGFRSMGNIIPVIAPRPKASLRCNDCQFPLHVLRQEIKFFHYRLAGNGRNALIIDTLMSELCARSHDLLSVRLTNSDEPILTFVIIYIL
jgi:hypothetical protein